MYVKSGWKCNRKISIDQNHSTSKLVTEFEFPFSVSCLLGTHILLDELSDDTKKQRKLSNGFSKVGNILTMHWPEALDG